MKEESWVDFHKKNNGRKFGHKSEEGTYGRNMQVNWEKTTELVQKQLEEDEELRSRFSGDIFAGLRANLSQQRNMVTHIAIVSGALASFSLLRLGSAWGLSKIFLVLAIICLLIVIGSSFYLLNKILDYENSELSKLLQEYSDMISKIMESRKNFLENRDAQKYTAELTQISNEFKAKREKEKSEEISKLNWWVMTKKTLIFVLILALGFNIFSLIL